MSKIKINKSLEGSIKYLIKYYDGDKNKVMYEHAIKNWNAVYQDVLDLKPLELAQILLGNYELEITERDLDDTFRFKIGVTNSEYLAMKLNGRYAVAWVEDDKPMMSHHSIDDVIRFITNKAWSVI